MSAPLPPDLSDTSRCVSIHWSMPVQCVLPRTHRENWHEAWHPETGNRMRYRRPIGATQELHHGVWHNLKIPAPAPSAEAEVERLTARVAELETERHSTNESLNDATVSDRDELKLLRDHIAELEAKIERRRLRLIAAEDDLLQVRGVLSPSGFPRKVPMELGASVVPAVEWLVDRVAELEAAATAEVTAYRAEYSVEGLRLGLYTTEAAAREHCDTLLRRENGGRTWDWAPGEDGDLVQFFVSQLSDRPEQTTGYLVTPVTVAAEYDAEADE